MFIWLAPDMNLQDYLGQRVDISEVFGAIYKAFYVTVAVYQYSYICVSCRWQSISERHYATLSLNCANNFLKMPKF